MVKLKLSVTLIAALVFCGSSSGQWAPAGTEYLPPEGGTLALSEDYGTSADGIGSWSDVGGGTITETSDSVILDVADKNYVYLQLPWRPRATNYVIDVGIKNWTTTNDTTSQTWSGAWNIDNNDHGVRQVFAMRPTDGGQFLATKTEEMVPFALDTGHVVRFSNPTGPWSPNECYATVDTQAPILETPSYAGLEIDGLRLTTGTGGNSSVEIAWVRVYEELETTEAPLSEKEMWLPEGTMYMPPDMSEGGDLVMDEIYGTSNPDVVGTSDPNYFGSWVEYGGDITVTSDSLLAEVEGNGVYMNLPWRPGSLLYVIDVGIKGWSTTQTNPNEFSTDWSLQNSDGDKTNCNPRFTMKPGGELDNNNSETIPFAQNTGHVVRFTSDDPWAPYYCIATANFGDTITAPGKAARLLEDALLLEATASDRNSTVKIAWVKVYQDVTSTEAPIAYAEPQECGDAGTVYLMGDISGPDGEPDCYVDIHDIRALASQWLTVTE